MLVLASMLAVPAQGLAADHYVRPGGTGSGADWTNAYANLPATLIRGDRYFLADGSYGSYTFDDANSGALEITIVKATAGDHGTDAGWSAAYGDGQAVFSHWNIYTDYYTFDGVTRNADWRQGAVSAYGIKVAGDRPVRLDNAAGTGGDNLTFRYIDLQGGGRDTGSGDDVIYGLTGNSNITFQYCALHDSDRTIFLMRGNWRNLLVDHSYLARNTSTPAIHGELLSMTSSDGVVFSNNIIEDIEGTAIFAGLNGGAAANWKIYGNVIFHSAAYAADSGRVSGHNWGIAGIVFVANDASNANRGDNFWVYNNTIYNIKGSYSGVVIQLGTGNIVQNNVWYGSVRTNNSFSGALGYNWYYNTQADGDSTATKVVCSSNCNVFVGASSKDFTLATAIPGGVNLAAPFNVDPNGTMRGGDGTWDRGAFEFGGGSTSSTPSAPSNLRIVSQ
jgi:hypothetical protein